MSGPAALREALKGANRVLVTAEALPDGDAFAAELTLYHVIRHLEPAACVVLANDGGCPDAYAFIPRSGRITPTHHVESGGFDVGIVVDGGVERAGEASRALFDQARIRAIVDHHRLGSQESYDICWVEPEAPATVEMLFDFFEGPEAVPLDAEVASAIYLGLSFDTGSFRYPSTRPRTHAIAARLLETGLDFAAIEERLHLFCGFQAVRAVGAVLSRARRSQDGVVWAVVQPEEQQATRRERTVWGRAVGRLCFAREARMAVLIFPLDDGSYRLSLRSRGAVDVARLARHLDANGGGHARAAGCRVAGPPEEVVERIRAYAEQAGDNGVSDPQPRPGQ